MRYDKEFKQQALQLSDEIGIRAAAEKLEDEGIRSGKRGISVVKKIGRIKGVVVFLRTVSAR